MTPASVPAPGQDNPQERMAYVIDGIRKGHTPSDVALREFADTFDALSADLEAATRERNALAARLRDSPIGGNGTHWEGCWRSHIDCAGERAEAAERALAELQAKHAHLESEWELGHDRGDSLVYRDEREAFDVWQRSGGQQALEAARDALREIGGVSENPPDWQFYRKPEDREKAMSDRAQAALDASASTEESAA